MEASPSDPKRISIVALLFPLLSALFVGGLIGWQAYTVQHPRLSPELTAASKALKVNNVEQARQQFDKALSNATDLPMQYQSVMGLCRAFGRWDLAVGYGERAIQVCKYASNPARAALYESLASCYADGHEPSPQPRATEYARRAVELMPDDANTLNTLGYILSENVRTEAEANIALGYVNQALTLLRGQVAPSPESVAVVEDSYGWALYRRGQFHAEDYAHAADAMRQAVADMPGETADEIQKVVYYHLGAACRAAGQIEEARHALQIALVYDPHYAEAQKELYALPPAPKSVPLTSVAAPASPSPPSPIMHISEAPPQTHNGKPVFTPLRDDKSLK